MVSETSQLSRHRWIQRCSISPTGRSQPPGSSVAPSGLWAAQGWESRVLRLLRLPAPRSGQLSVELVYQLCDPIWYLHHRIMPHVLENQVLDIR